MSFLETFEQERSKLLRRAEVYGAPEPEEAVQDAYETAWRVVQRGETTNPKALLYRAVEHRAIDQFRKRQTRRRVETPVGLLPELEAIENDRELYSIVPPREWRDEFVEDFDRAVRAIEDDDRDPYILTELRGLSQAEAGGVLDMHQTTVSRRANRARLNIQKEIA